MNPDEMAARQAMMARLVGQPQPQLQQLGANSGMPQPPQAQPVPVQTPQNQLGTQTRKASPTEKLVKSILPATSNAYGQEVSGPSKAVLANLIKYL